MKPSYMALSVSGFLIGVFMIIVINNWYTNKSVDISMYQTMMLILMASSAMGIHGLGHAYAEVNFDYDPLKGGFVY